MPQLRPDLPLCLRGALHLRSIAPSARAVVKGRKPEAGSEGSREVERRAQPTGDVVAMEPPDDLSDAAAQIWRVLLPDLITAKVFRLSDAFLLSELCEAFAEARAFRAEMAVLRKQMDEVLADPDQGEKTIEKYETLSGQVKRARTGYRQAMTIAMTISGEFGITPVARLRLGLMKTAEGGTLRGLLAGGSDDAGPA